MERISVTQAARKFSDLLNRVFFQGAVVELERGHKIIARISPVNQDSPVKVKDLNQFFAELPSLGKDAADFAADLERIRHEAISEKSKWD